MAIYLSEGSGWPLVNRDHCYKKRKDSLEDSLDQVLFATELEFPKILVPRLPQNTSNVNNECAGKSKELYSLCDQLPFVLGETDF